MPTEAGRVAPRPPLLLDMRRVLSTPHDLSCRMSGFVDSNRNRATWGDEDRTRLFGAANLVAYHVARSIGAPIADKILRAELACLLELSRTSPKAPVADLGLDPFLNRIRLAALTGEVDSAFLAINDCLGGVDVGARDDDHSLLYGARLFTGYGHDRLHSLLRPEKLLIAWRSGRLSATDGESARTLIAQCAECTAQLKAEVELRLRLDEPAPPTYSLAPGDTLKRAMHRALVYIDQFDPPPEDPLLEVTRRGLERLDAMSFVCPSTAHLWARTTERWYASWGVGYSFLAEHAVSLAQARISATVAHDLDATMGPPSPDWAVNGTSVGAEHVNRIIELLERASGADMEIVAHDQ